MPVGLIGMAVFKQQFDQLDHLVDKLGRPRTKIGIGHVQRMHVVQIPLIGFPGDFTDRLAGFLMFVQNLVVNVGNVGNVSYVVFAVNLAQNPVEHVKNHR